MADNDAADANGATPKSYATKIPLFRGVADTVQIEAWCRAVDRHITQAGWEGDEEKNKKGATAAIEQLREVASDWADNLLDDNEAAYNSWALLKPKLIARFSSHQNASQQVRGIANLTQKQAESVAVFYDRVQTGLRRVCQMPMQDIDNITDRNVADVRYGAKLIRNHIMGRMFVAGLRVDIRKTVEAQITNDHDLDDIKAAAIRAETSDGSPAKASNVAAIASMQLQTSPPMGATALPVATVPPQTAGTTNADALKAEIAALSSRLNQFTAGGNKRQGQGRRSGGNATTTSSPAQPRPPFSQRNWTYCFRCKQWGVHIQSECKLSMEDIRQLSPQNKSEKPSGQPFDRQYPN